MQLANTTRPLALAVCCIFLLTSTSSAHREDGSSSPCSRPLDQDSVDWLSADKPRYSDDDNWAVITFTNPTDSPVGFGDHGGYQIEDCAGLLVYIPVSLPESWELQPGDSTNFSWPLAANQPPYSEQREPVPPGWYRFAIGFAHGGQGKIAHLEFLVCGEPRPSTEGPLDPLLSQAFCA